MADVFQVNGMVKAIAVAFRISFLRREAIWLGSMESSTHHLPQSGDIRRVMGDTAADEYIHLQSVLDDLTMAVDNLCILYPETARLWNEYVGDLMIERDEGECRDAAKRLGRTPHSNTA
jgi:hypothetical protein